MANVKLTGAEQASLAERPVERRVGGLDSCPRCLMEAHLSLLSCGDNDTRGCEIHGSMTQDEMAIYNADVMKDATALYFLSWNYQVQARRASRNGGKL